MRKVILGIDEEGQIHIDTEMPQHELLGLLVTTSNLLQQDNNMRQAVSQMTTNPEFKKFIKEIALEEINDENGDTE